MERDQVSDVGLSGQVGGYRVLWDTSHLRADWLDMRQCHHYRSGLIASNGLGDC